MTGGTPPVLPVAPSTVGHQSTSLLASGAPLTVPEWGLTTLKGRSGRLIVCGPTGHVTSLHIPGRPFALRGSLYGGPWTIGRLEGPLDSPSVQ